MDCSSTFQWSHGCNNVNAILSHHVMPPLARFVAESGGGQVVQNELETTSPRSFSKYAMRNFHAYNIDL